MSELKSLTNDNRLFKPTKKFVDNANLDAKKFEALNKQASKNYPGFWAKLAEKHIHWHKPFTKTLNDSKAPFFKWFEDGKLNVSYNCLDRHVKTQPNKTAIIFESDTGFVETVTYKELHSKVSRFANGLKSIGVEKGERVVIYIPHSIEAIVAMQACARIGAIHSVVFGGFSSKALAERIADAGAKVIITSDGQRRGGKILPLKSEVNAALDLLAKKSTVKHVVVHKKTGHEEHEWKPKRDIWWHELIKDQSDICPVTKVDSEHPLFILYTSGSTGTPKGVQHSSGGYLLGAIMSMEWVFDSKPDDVFWCTADVGWITGHTYVCYGPLAVGATQVIFEGVPTYPTSARFWQIIESHKVSVFYTAPTAIRALIKAGADLPNKFDLSSLRLLGSVGEPINPEAWMWYYETIGKKKCPIVDTWWQTETGSNMLAPIPGVTNLKPGSCTHPLPGIMVDIIDESGKLLGNDDTGYLVIKKPFPSQIRTIWNNPERYVSSYYPQEVGQGKYYVAGDSAHKDKDGYFWILGRIDDVLNVSGHRLGTMEIESALAAHPDVAEAAVVGKPHEVKGESVFAFIVCKGERPTGQAGRDLEAKLREWVGKEIGPIAKPDEIRFGDNLPKTRSGKIMRRLLRSIAKSEEITQDVSTLENPAILEQLKKRD
jgi:acetyl-CoA synthetase